MPTNVSYEYTVAKREYQKASTSQEKLKALRKMLKTAPDHKGAEKLRANIRKRISKYKKEAKKEKKAKKGRPTGIKKADTGQIVFVGLPNSGKSTLLSKLSGKDVEVARYKFTTTSPVQKMIPFENIKLQGVEIPAIYGGFYESDNGKELFGIIRNADLVAVVLKDDSDFKVIKQEFDKANIVLGASKKRQTKFKHYLPSIRITWDDFDDSDLPEKFWSKLNKIRVQTKTAGKVAEKPIILKKGATVEEAVKEIHKDFLKNFRYVKVWGPSAKFKGQQVGLDHTLKDRDIIEVFTK